MLELYKDYVMGEVLGDELIVNKRLKNKETMNDEWACIKVERVKK